MELFTRLFIVIFLGLTSLQSCIVDTHSIKGNGNIVKEQIMISDYEKIQLSGFADVIYEQRSWDNPYLQISVDENILPLLDIRVANGTLFIQPKDNQNISPTRFKIYTNSTAINNVKIAGSGDVFLKGEVNADDITVTITGSGTLVSDSLYCENFKLGIFGSGKANLGGVCNEASFSISGSGNVEAFNYQAQDLECSISGSGNMKTHVNRSLKASIAGSGNIKYKGNPQTVNQKISGSGNISKEE